MLWIDERHSNVQAHDYSSFCTTFFLETRLRCLLIRRLFTERSCKKLQGNAWKLRATSGPIGATAAGVNAHRSSVLHPRCDITISRYHALANENPPVTPSKTPWNRGREASVRKPARLARSAIDLKLRFVSRIPHLTTLVTLARCTLTSTSLGRSSVRSITDKFFPQRRQTGGKPPPVIREGSSPGVVVTWTRGARLRRSVPRQSFGCWFPSTGVDRGARRGNDDTRTAEARRVLRFAVVSVDTGADAAASLA